jgi:hypothetical protein
VGRGQERRNTSAEWDARTESESMEVNVDVIVVVGNGNNAVAATSATAADVCGAEGVHVGESMGECITNIICCIKPSSEAGTERAGASAVAADAMRGTTDGICSHIT